MGNKRGRGLWRWHEREPSQTCGREIIIPLFFLILFGLVCFFFFIFHGYRKIPALRLWGTVVWYYSAFLKPTQENGKVGPPLANHGQDACTWSSGSEEGQAVLELHEFEEGTIVRERRKKMEFMMKGCYDSWVCNFVFGDWRQCVCVYIYIYVPFIYLNRAWGALRTWFHHFALFIFFVFVRIS